MHFKSENGPNTNVDQHIVILPQTVDAATTTSAGTNCSTSSTDSGVVILDNRTIYNNASANSNNANINDAKPNENLKNLLNNQIDSSKANAANGKVNIENIINITNPKPDGSGSKNARVDDHFQEQWLKNNNNRPINPTTITTSTTTTTNQISSPAASIRSTSISIVSIDENAIDSSVVDSDSDLDADAEGIRGNYIVKKLGQQTTYPPDSPHLPNLSKGLQVVGQKISQSETGSVEAAGALAENIFNGGGGLSSSSATALSPLQPASTHQIGSIALTNSTDVTFGDKHFYEGPVTIQQFLIDSRDKWKPLDEDGVDNPTYGEEHATKDSKIEQLTNPPSRQDQPYKFIFNRKAVIIGGTIIVLTILIGILIVATSTLFKSSIRKSKLLGDGDDSRKNIPISSTIDDSYTFNGTLCIVTRGEWQGRPAKGPLDKLVLPVHRVVISHTASDVCHEKTVCSFRLQVIQNFHMDSRGWDDISYNFLIGGDGLVYEGRGWDNQGAHTKGYNVDSLGISFIGTFTKLKPTNNQLLAAQLLIAEGVRLSKLVPDYKLYGARQLSGTESPGDALYKIIKGWPHWSEQV